MVMQEPFLFARTLRENIGIALEGDADADAKIEDAARTACLHETITGFTDGYDIRQTDRGGGRENTAESTDTGGYAADADAYDSGQHDLDTGQCNLPSPFL